MKAWLPDLIWRGGKFEPGMALMVDPGGRIECLSSDAADVARAERLAGRAMLPGLVNAHSHAFQRVIRGRTEHRSASAGPDTFWTWREAMYHAADLLSPEALYHAARMAYLEMLQAGITTVGEFHYLHSASDGSSYPDRNALAHQVLQAAEELGLRIALLNVAYVRGGLPRFLTPRVEEFIADTESLAERCKSEQAWIGVAPHSVRAVPLDYLLRISEYAREKRWPIHMHVAEQPAELKSCVAEYGRRPVELLHQDGVLDEHFTAIHAIHVDDREIEQLASARSFVCACPTTERNLGDGICPADRLARAGVGLALGSDSNVQIDLLEDARELEYHLRLQRLERVIFGRPDLAANLFACATENGAASLSAPGGSLDPGRAADFFTVDLNHPSIAGADSESLMSNIVFSLDRQAIRDVFVGGRRIVQDGHHALESEIIRNFAEVQRMLWTARHV